MTLTGSLLPSRDVYNRNEREALRYTTDSYVPLLSKNMLMIRCFAVNGSTREQICSCGNKWKNNQIVPIAFGICKGETGPCWSWWMSVLKECIDDNPNLLFVSDRHPAIAMAVENEFPLACHVAYTREDYATSMNILQIVQPDAYEKLCRGGPQRWSRAHFPLVRYNYITSNSVESVNACSVIYRKEPVLKLAETYRAMVHKWYYKCRQLAANMTYEITDWEQTKWLKKDEKCDMVAGKLQIFVSHTPIDFSTVLIPNNGSLEESLAARYKLEIYINHIGVDFVISKYIFPNASLAEMMNHVITDYSSENEGIIRKKTQNDYTFDKMVEWAEQEHFGYEETKTSYTISPISTMLSSTIESCLSYTYFFSSLTYYMAYGENKARQAIVLKQQREIQAEETLADELLCNLTCYTEEMQALDEEAILEEQMLALMHRFADRFTDRRVEINNLMVLHDHPLIDYGKYALGCMTGADMKKYVKLKGVRDELLMSWLEGA
ncbi:transposase, MuDR, MULE transposase domain protein [Tanacetum coccineum]